MAALGGGICLTLWKALTGSKPYYERRKGSYSTYDVTSTGARVYRNADVDELKLAPFAGCDTVYDVFEYAISKNGNRPAMGERAIVGVRGKKKKNNPATPSVSCSSRPTVVRSLLCPARCRSLSTMNTAREADRSSPQFPTLPLPPSWRRCFFSSPRPSVLHS